MIGLCRFARGSIGVQACRRTSRGLPTCLSGRVAVVTKQQLSVDVQNKLIQRRTPLVRPRPVPPPGARLRKAVDAVLSELGKESAAPLPQLDDQLRTALAWTAAAGETCRIPTAVLAVRTARSRLGMADPDQAKVALLAARSHLDHPVPSQRDAR
jgi:hypothetical protein